MRSIFLVLLLVIFLPVQGVVYDLRDDPIDIVIPCCGKDVEILEHCIAGAKQNIANVRRIIVVSAEKYTEYAEWYDERDYPFSKRDIALVLGVQEDHNRLGWYYQQLLKIYAPITIPGISSNVLIIDADTVFLRPTKFLNKKNGGLYAYDTRIHTPYFTHMEKLVPELTRVFPKLSGICHHMLLQRDVIIHLLNSIESEHKTEAWKAFYQLVDPMYHGLSGMAEYEIYFNFVFSNTNQVELRRLKFANITRISDAQDFRRRKYDFVSCHHFMRR